jgi:hypothetical protein
MPRALTTSILVPFAPAHDGVPVRGAARRGRRPFGYHVGPKNGYRHQAPAGQ